MPFNKLGVHQSMYWNNVIDTYNVFFIICYVTMMVFNKWKNGMYESHSLLFKKSGI
jgi:hypothetical protein